jgi:alpha-beta hydrolase superfamily lysophospholipase
MSNDNITIAFFNRPHFVQGAQLLATTLCMLGVIFAGLDWRGMGVVRPAAFIWLGAGFLLSVVAAIVSRRALPGMTALASGVAMGVMFLGVTWFLARTGG